MNKYKRHIYLFIFITMLIGIAGFAVLFINFRKQVQLQNEMLRIEKNLIQADSLTNNLLQIESLKRGFQLTSDVSYLRDFNKIKTSCSNNLAKLEKNTLFPKDRVIVAQIDSLSRIRVANLDSGIMVFTSLGANAAMEFMEIKGKKEIREKLNDQLGILKNSFLQRLKENTASINSKSDHNLTGLIVLLSIFILVLLVAGRTFRRVQKKIIKNHIRFKEAQRIGKIGSWEWNMVTNKVTWSQEQFRLFGQDRKKFIPTVEGYLSFLSEQDQKDTMALIESAMDQKRNFAVEHEITRGDGSKLMVYHQGMTLYDENKKPVGMFGTTQDISDRKKVEKELRLAQEKYQEIIDNTADGIYQSTVEGQFIMANPAMAKMFGYKTPGEFISYMTNIGAQLYANPDDRQRMSELLVRNDHVENFEAPLLTRNGDVIWVSESTRAVRNDRGAILYFEGTLKNITEKKKSEEQLLSLSNRLQLAVHATCIGIWDWDISNRVIVWDDEMHRIYNVSPDDPRTISEAWTATVHPDDIMRVKAELELAIKGEKEYNTEFRIVWKDKTVHHVKGNALVIKDANGNPARMIGTNADITERKEAEEEILQLNRSLDQFANITAHDLQEPIRMVSGFLGLLDKKYNGIMDEQGKAYIYRAKDGADRMSILIKDLLEFSRSGNTAAKKEYVDLSHVIDLVDKDLSIVMADTGTILRLPDSMPVIFGTQSALYRLLLNLVSNGIKFRKKDTAPEVTITTNELSDCWEFTVRDNGIGVAEKDQSKLFQAFQRLHRREEYPGTGLGLVTCKKIVETHGGRIWMTSEFGKGTTFHFTLSKAQDATMAA